MNTFRRLSLIKVFFINLDINYTYVTKQPILNKFDKIKEKEKIPKERLRKKQPKRRDWVDGHVTEINDWTPFEIKDQILDLDRMKKEINLVKNEKQDNIGISLINKINLSLVKRPESSDSKSQKNSHKSHKSNNSYNSNNSNMSHNSHNERRIFAKKTVGKNSNFCNIDYSNIISEKNDDLVSLSDSGINKKGITNLQSQVNAIVTDEDMEQGISVREEEKFSEPSKCFICNWTYPKDMDLREKNAHMNHCIEGRGENHRRSYLDNLRYISKSKKKNYENGDLPGKKLFKSNSGKLSDFFNK
jgi:hypothetical protein